MISTSQENNPLKNEWIFFNEDIRNRISDDYL